MLVFDDDFGLGIVGKIVGKASIGKMGIDREDGHRVSGRSIPSLPFFTWAGKGKVLQVRWKRSTFFAAAFGAVFSFDVRMR